MKTLNVRLEGLVLALVLAALPLASAQAQSRRIDGGVVSRDAFSFVWEMHLNPPAPPLAQSFGTAVLEIGSNVVQRVMLDRAQKVYFGYNARVEPLPDHMFRITFQPLSMSPELQRTLGSRASTWKMLPAPGFPAPRTIRAGEWLELPLLTGSTRGQTLTDYVTVRESEAPGFRTLESGRPNFAFAPGAPRDFNREDVELRLDQPHVVALVGRDGSAIREPGTGSPFLKSADDVTGTVVWVYVPTRGRYLLSLTPRQQAGFVKAGDVRGSSLKFRMDDDLIDILARSRIAPGQAAFNLYVLRQPGWKPTYPNANLDTVHIGAADRAEYLVGK